MEFSKSGFDGMYREAEESTEVLDNPARGWYQIYTFSVEEKPSFQKFFWCGNDEDTIAMLIINIGVFREGPITDEALGHMREILSFFSSAGYDIVLRVVYDHEGKALEKEPFFFGKRKVLKSTGFQRDGVPLAGGWGAAPL